MQNESKKQYSTPEIATYGTMVDLTLSDALQQVFDNSTVPFTAGTPTPPIS